MHGDSLDFLREMNSNSDHLVATEPAFNKGRDFEGGLRRQNKKQDNMAKC